MEDQAQIEEEGQIGDRPRAGAAPFQLPQISEISERDKVLIARNREIVAR